ncbi:hypothetical protein BJ322DRAFT_1020756 [Thelephora terrestris]|uniref:NACHT domain-containing protein n=1 Tax=Thelephora terrestris TaxID=56493 RepID=A0A9P6HG24_9AGAM|nr:hypothetical protein BJ322DRAFT_1020756 [Thelephora terrestris]
MAPKSHRSKRRVGVLPELAVAIEALGVAKDACSVAPAQFALCSAYDLLTVIKENGDKKQDFIDLGICCADVCAALNRGLGGKRSGEISESVYDAIEQLITIMVEIQGETVKEDERSWVSKLLGARGDKDTIAAWKQDLNRTELATVTQVAVADVGEVPPPAPRACFGRGELIGEVVRRAENLESIALIGAGGIGKSTIALAVLHDDRIKQQFGSSRRFIGCDQFPASLPHFLAHLSKVIGAGVENPEDLTHLQRFLTSKEMLIILDGAESILDPKGTDAREIYDAVDELCQFKTICVCVVSRITTVPQYRNSLYIPTLSMEAAQNVFYGIYEWRIQQAQGLRTHFHDDLAATIELLFASPTFCNLGPDAREFLEVVASFPQGVDENNLDLLFPTIPDNKNLVDKLCDLSLVYRRIGFIKVLAAHGDYFYPRDPRTSPLLCATTHHYLTRLLVRPSSDPTEARWFKSEDINIEHLLHIATFFQEEVPGVWVACANFMSHLRFHRPRQTVLGRNIETLPDDHPSKPGCLFELSRLYESIGNYAEAKRLLTHTLTLWRQRADDSQVAQTLSFLAHVNQGLGLFTEEIQEAKEAMEIYERFGDRVGQADCLHNLALSLLGDNQLDDAEGYAIRMINFLSEKGEEYLLCKSHRTLGIIYDSKGVNEKAIHQFKTAFRIASPFSWQDQLFGVHYTLALLLCAEGELGDANTHIEQARSHTVDDAHKLARAMNVQAWIYYQEHRLEHAKFKALRAVVIYEKLGSTQDAGACGELLLMIERAMERRCISDTGTCGTLFTTSTKNSQGTGIGGSWRMSYMHVVLGIIALLLFNTLPFGY